MHQAHRASSWLTSIQTGLLAVLLLLGLAAASSAEHHEKPADAPSEAEQEKAVAIIEAAQEAAKKVTAVSFVGNLEPTGAASYFVQPSSGQGVISGWDAATNLPQHFYVKAKLQRDDVEVEIEGGGDGESYYVVDHSTKKGYEDIDPEVMGSMGNALRGVGLPEFVHPDPFGNELAGELTYQGAAEVGGIQCDKIHVAYAGGRGESTWFISQEDHLPRQRIRHFKTPRGDGDIIITMRELNLQPEIDEALFKMRLPEGYEAVDDFAP